MITKEKYAQYIHDFNTACAATNNDAFNTFHDKYYEPDAVFEYIPTAAKNCGKTQIVSFLRKVHAIMQEEIKPHRSLIISETAIAVEAPIDFKCKEDLEWVGIKHKAGDSFRLMMAAFYDLSRNEKFKYVRVYSIYNPHYYKCTF